MKMAGDDSRIARIAAAIIRSSAGLRNSSVAIHGDAERRERRQRSGPEQPGEALGTKDLAEHREGRADEAAHAAFESYSADRKKSRTPDLTEHNCINLRLPTDGGGLYAWKERARTQCPGGGVIVFNGAGALLDAALKRISLSHRGTRLTLDRCPPFSGCHLYYPSRQQSSRCFWSMRSGIVVERDRRAGWLTRQGRRGGRPRHRTPRSQQGGR
jgi:hypothetical protein